MKYPATLLLFGLLLGGGPGTQPAPAQPAPSGIQVPVVADPILSVDFETTLRPWDGFGVQYVETAQTRDYEAWPQDYGSFSLLSEEDRQAVLDLIFGPDGLRPALSKMLLDPFHEGRTAADNDNDDPYTRNPDGFDPTTTTRWMRYFNREGLARTRARGGDLTILASLYGPPAWMTEQRFVLGPTLDPAAHDELAEYMVAWVASLRDEENLPVRYLSLHNQGDAYYRWPRDGSNPGEDHREYNLRWPPEQVVALLPRVRAALDSAGLSDVGLTPGETQTWYRFDEWGYARALAADTAALDALALITSHSFANAQNPGSIYYGDWRSNGQDLLRTADPDLHAWVTSMSWGRMDATFVDHIRRNIYMAKTNGVIPWALVQRADAWIGGDPNPGTAFRVNNDSSYTVLPGYYYYKQVCRAGQPGMAVAAVTSLDPSVGVIAWAGNGTRHPNTFVVINTDDETKATVITVRGSRAGSFAAYRTSDEDRHTSIGTLRVVDGQLTYSAPPNSVTTFYER